MEGQNILEQTVNLLEGTE